LLFCFHQVTTKEAADIGAAAKHHQVSRHDLRAKEKSSWCDKGPTSQHATAGTKLGPDKESRQTGAHVHAPSSLALHGPRPAGRQESQRQIPSLQRTKDSDHTSNICTAGN